MFVVHIRDRCTRGQRKYLFDNTHNIVLEGDIISRGAIKTHSRNGAQLI